MWLRNPNSLLSSPITTNSRGRRFFKDRQSKPTKTAATHKASAGNRKKEDSRTNTATIYIRSIVSSLTKISFVTVQVLLAPLAFKNSTTLAPGWAKLKCSQSIQSAATPSRPTRSGATEIVRPAGTTAWPGWEYLHQNSHHKITSSFCKDCSPKPSGYLPPRPHLQLDPMSQ